MPDFFLKVKATGTDLLADEVRKVEDAATKTEKKLSGLGEYLGELKGKVLGAFAVGAVVEFTNRILEGASALINLGRRANGSLEFLKQLQRGAKLSGTDVGELTSAFEGLSETQANLQAGIGRTADRLKAFKLLGITPEDLRNKSAEQLFASLTEKMKEGTITAEQYAAGIKVMGQAFRELGVASKRGLGDQLGKPTNTSDEEFLSEANETKNRLLATLFGFGKKTVRGGLTALEFFTAASEKSIGSVLQSLGAHKTGQALRNRGDELLTERAQVNDEIFGDGGAEQRQRLLDNQREAKKSAARMDQLKTQIRGALGEDADDVLDDLAEAGAKPEQYEKVLRRAKRAKEKAAAHEKHGVAVSQADSMGRLGLFVGGAQGASIQVQMHQQTNKLEEIRRELMKLNHNVVHDH